VNPWTNLCEIWLGLLPAKFCTDQSTFENLGTKPPKLKPQCPTSSPRMHYFHKMCIVLVLDQLCLVP